MKLAVGLYLAVIEWLPSARVDVANVAFPLARFTVASVVAPSMKVTVPVAGPPNAAVTVAVNVTAVLTTDGFAVEVRAVVVGEWIVNAVVSAPSTFPARSVL